MVIASAKGFVRVSLRWRTFWGEVYKLPSRSDIYLELRNRILRLIFHSDKASIHADHKIIGTPQKKSYTGDTVNKSTEPPSIILIIYLLDT